MKRAPQLPFALAALLAPPSASAQALYKCVSSDGRTVYQSEKCGQDARETAIQKDAGGPSRPAAPETLEGVARYPHQEAPALPPGLGVRRPPAQGSSRERNLVIKVTAAYRSCSEVPGFTARFDSAYRRFQQQNANAMASLQADPAAAAELERRSAAESAQIREGLATPQGEQQVKQYCDTLVGSGLESRQGGASTR